MARRSIAIAPLIAALIVGVAICAPVALVLFEANGWGHWGPRDSDALGFSLWQASLSAVMSCTIGGLFAWALFRRDFVGKSILLALIGAPFLLSVLVAILGLVLVFGPRGLVASVLPLPSIYGPYGVIIAHVFFNMPLATRVMFHGFQAIPPEHFRLAQSLGLNPAQTLWYAAGPMLRSTVPAVMSVIFLICLGSFTVPLTLGGGPQSTTLELGIYQAFRFDFDLGRAARLALTQAALGLGLTACAYLLGGHMIERGGARTSRIAWRASTAEAVFFWAVITVCAGFLLVPMSAALWRAMGGMFDLPIAVWGALGTSVYVAVGASVIAMLLGLALMQRAWGTWVSLLALSISPIVLGLGAYLGLRPFVLPTLWGKEVMMLSNALTALPFVTASLRPRYGDITGRYARLRASYGMSVWAWWMHVVLPNLAPTLGFSIGVSLALSMGDLGVILLFSDAQAPTLPQMIYAMMGQYRIDAATSAAILLMIASFSLFAICSWIGERYARL